MTLSCPSGCPLPPLSSNTTTTRTVEKPLRDAGLFVIRHATASAISCHEFRAEDYPSRPGVGAVPFHVEYRVYAAGFEPSLDELEGLDEITSIPRSMGLGVPLLALLIGVWPYWSSHGPGEWVYSVRRRGAFHEAT